MAVTPEGMLSRSFALWVFTLLTFVGFSAPGFAQVSARPLIVPNRLSQDVSFIDPISWTEILRLPLGGAPALAVVSSDDTFAFIALERNAITGRSSIVKIHLPSRTIVQTQSYLTSSQFVRLSITPDGETLFAVDRHQATLLAVRAADLGLRYAVSLCPTCNGSLAPLYASPQIVSTPDSAVLYAAVPVEAKIISLDVLSGAALSSHPLGLPGSSTAYSAISLFDVAPSIPIVTHPQLGLLATEMGSGWSLPLAIVPPGITSAETLALRLGVELFLIQGESSYESSPDVLRLYHVNSGGMLTYATAETSYLPIFNPLTFEVWSVCRSIPALQQCDPVRINATNLLSSAPALSIVGPGASSSGIPRFSADYHYYLYPMATLGQVLVIDTISKTSLPPIGVGQLPIGVF